MIQFGTGGWRAIIGDEFTRENVQLLGQSVVEEIKQKTVIIGYDRRFLSDVAARWLAEVFAGNGIKVHLIDKPVPTPLIMFAVKQAGIDFGFAITASHNPALYNGVKIFTKGGKDATEVLTNKLEENLRTLGSVHTVDFDHAVSRGDILFIDPQNDYIDSILNFIDMSAIRNAHLKVLVDTMHGVSKTSLSTILNTVRCDVDIINDRHDTLFGGKLPSPASTTLMRLSEQVVAGNYNLGVATDGDADRIGIIDESGKFVHPNILISLIYYYLLDTKKWRGPVVRNLSTTHLLDRIAHAYGQEVIETPVGFKHITSGMETYNAIIGGESSGGLTIKGHIHGKDGIFAAALLVEMVSVTQKNIGTLVSELYEKFGRIYSEERDYSFSFDVKNDISNKLFTDKKIPEFALEIDRVSYMDGLKIYFKDDSWISARFSGTEPLLRIFCEASEKDTCLSLVKIMESFLFNDNSQ